MKHALLVAISLAPLACAGPETVTIPPATPATPAAEVTVAAAPAPAPPPAVAPQAAPTANPAAPPPAPQPVEVDGKNGAQFGIIGLLDSGGSSAPAAPWGRDAAPGSDPNVLQGAVGDSFGAGGLGLGGGGRGEGIGLGSIGTLGHGVGAGHGFGQGGRHTKPPSVRVGAVSVSGRLPPEVVQRIVRQSFGRFRLCYENGLRKNAKLQGKVSVKFTIEPNGAVGSANNAGSDLPDGSVVGCVIKSFLGLSFPQPEGGKVVVVYPLSFAPGEAAPAQPAAPPAPAAPAKPTAPPTPAKPEPPPSQSGTKAPATGSARD